MLDRGEEHLGRVSQAGHLLAVGPLLDRTSQFRGLPTLNGDADEARALMESDPAVQAGKYAIIALPWMVPAGAISFSPARFPRPASEASES